MADKKISALTGATTPLAGTEVLPIVQGGSTVKVSVANVTAGRTVSVAALGVGTASPGASVDISTASGNVYLRDGTTGNASIFMTAAGASYAEFQSAAFGVSFNTPLILNRQGANIGIGNVTAPTEKVDMIGNLKISSGDVKIGTAGKGIDFSANGGDVLSQYDEGTWTPNQGAGLTVVGAFSSTGTFTRIGRQVTVQGRVVGATSIACSAFGVISSNLPFSSGGTTFVGSLFGGSPAAGGTTVTSAGIVYSVNAVSAGGDITFTITYFI